MARRRRRSRQRKTGGHRQAPRPASWDCQRGTCRFCGQPIIEHGKHNTRKHWHQACADIWVVANSPAKMRRHIFLRERGTCQGCGFQSPVLRDFHADHIQPLFEANGRLTFYLPDNVQLLCKPCHKVKTRSDMERFRSLKETE